MANDWRKQAAKLCYNIKLLKENSRQETKHFCYFFIYMFNLAKVATSNPFVLKEHNGKISCKFAISPDILVAKGENISANTTLLLTISSPDIYGIYIFIWFY